MHYSHFPLSSINPATKKISALSRANPLTAKNKAKRVEYCKQLLKIYEYEPEKFF